jgi:hypothetical protein
MLEMGVRNGGKKKKLEVKLWTFHPEPKGGLMQPMK